MKVRVCIDPGHGAHDSGAVGPGRLFEKDIVLKVAHKLRERLKDDGIDVVMTREDDRAPGGVSPGSHRSNLQARCDISNAFGSDLFISLHCNGAHNYASGYEVWHAEGSKVGRRLATLIRDELSVRLPDHVNRGARSDVTRYAGGMYVLRHTEAPAVLVEIEFITNHLVAKKIVTDEFQDAVAESIRAAIAKLQIPGPQGEDASRQHGS